MRDPDVFGATNTELADYIRDQVCCPRIHGCELGGAAECPAERVRVALGASTASPEGLGVPQDELIPTPANKSADLDAEPSALAGLLARVEAARADHEWALVREAAATLLDIDDIARSRVNRLLDAGGFTDAALALCERVLPGWKWFVSFGYADSDGGPYYAMVRPSGQHLAEPVGHKASPALAILAAMLKALVAQAAGPEGGQLHRLDEPLLSKGGGESPR